MFQIVDLSTGKVLLGGFTTEAAARRAAWRIFPDRMWAVREAEG